MRITTNSTKRFPCGAYYTIVGPWGSRATQRFCKTWCCSACRQSKIENYHEDIRYAMTKIAGAHLFVATIIKQGKSLSNFTQKKVKGDYALIKTSNGATLISTRTFLGATRREKKKYLKVDLLEVLSSPWSRGRRVSFSSGIKRLIRSRRSRCGRDVRQIIWAAVRGRRDIEFRNLCTDEEKALWLSNNRYDAEMRPEGERFLEQTLERIPAGTQLMQLIEQREQKEREEQKRRWLAIEQSIKNGSWRW